MTETMMQQRADSHRSLPHGYSLRTSAVRAPQFLRTTVDAESRARDAEAMLDVSGTASILLDERGRVVYMNQPAQILALEEDGLCVSGQHISPTQPCQRTALQTLIRAASQDGLQGAIALVRRADRRSLNVLVSPFNRVNRGLSTARVLLLVSDPERVVNFPDAILRALYDLTPAETEIANGLLTGFSVEEVARLRKTSVTTIRSQLKTLLGKTGTRRQAELVWLLASLPRTEAAESSLCGSTYAHTDSRVSPQMRSAS